MIHDITPVPKPRMTRADRWKKRPVVLRYWDFCDKVEKANIIIPDKPNIIFYIPMPSSWSKKKKRDNLFDKHTQRPDLDNYVKALFDAVYKEDSHIWTFKATKIWAEKGQIEIKNMEC